MAEPIKSGKEILSEFFAKIFYIPGADKEVTKVLAELYKEGKLSDVNVRNELQKLRKQNAN